MTDIAVKRKIILLFEGTGNSPKKNPSIITRIREYVNCDSQIVHLENGSGTRHFKLWYGITGLDSYHIVSRQYRWLCKYIRTNRISAKDIDLYVFGFSRGAYQARLFVNLVRRCGIGSGRLYRSVVGILVRFAIARWLVRMVPHRFFKREVELKYIGLVDTVSSIPCRTLLSYADDLEFSIHVRHAVAIHEYRRKFRPELLVLGRNAAPANAWEEKLFLGSHSDVGWAYNGTRHERINHAYTKTYGKMVAAWLLSGAPELLLTDKYETASWLAWEKAMPSEASYIDLVIHFALLLHDSRPEASNIFGILSPVVRRIKNMDYSDYHYSARAVRLILERLEDLKQRDLEVALYCRLLLEGLKLQEFNEDMFAVVPWVNGALGCELLRGVGLWVDELKKRDLLSR